MRIKEPKWRLYNSRTGEAPPPREYNHRDQYDVVRETLEALQKYDVVLLQGAVGTGKSVIALHLIAEFGKGIIQTPSIALEKQYHRDYEVGDRHVLLDDGSPLKVSGIKGRNNFQCPCNYSIVGEDDPHTYTKRIKMVRKNEETSCDAADLPCRIRLEGALKGWTRYEIARICPYWSPIHEEETIHTWGKALDREPIPYNAVGGRYAVIRRNHSEDENCPYLRQFTSYVKRNVALVMNSAMWETETLAGRKPRVPIEIIDEGDAYLDGLCFQEQIARKGLETIFKKNKEVIEEAERVREADLKLVDEIWDKFNQLIEFAKVKGENKGKKEKEYMGRVPGSDEGPEIHGLRFGEVFYSLVRLLEELHGITGSYGKISIILGYLGSAFFNIHCSEDGGQDKITIYLPDPSFVWRMLRKKSADKIVLMSATFQKPEVLEEVYGLKDYAIVLGDMRFPGILYARRTGREEVVNNDKWQHNDFRSRYFKLRDEILPRATPPKLVLPWGKKYARGIDKNLKDTTIFEDPSEDEMWSTVANRGVDLPDDKCRSIIPLKCPYSDMSDPVLKTMRARLGKGAFRMYYNDKMRRTLIQQVGRGVRNENDWCEVWSPDMRVFETLFGEWKGDIEEIRG